MRISMSVERLRVWLLVGAALLVAVIAAFLGYAHYRAHRFLTELPAKLGIDITRETNGFTYSQSGGPNGKTLYTIHAAKAIQHKDGKYTLHDVGIVVYGHDSNRADRIYGSEFEYDLKNQVIRAVGEVRIDLQAPAPASAKDKRAYAAGGESTGTEPVGGQPGKYARIIHVKTSGLVFMQKLGIAATDKEIEFESGGITGNAVGADYDSDTGVMVLHSSVRVVGLQQGQPATLTATRAELDRPAKLLVLTQAKYVLVGGAKAGVGQTVEAQRMVVHLREDGSAERMDAEGAVTLTDGDGGRVVAPRGNVLLDAQSKPQSAVLSGGLHYVADESLRQAQGEATEGRASFDKAGRLQHMVLTGAVKLHERVRAADAANALWSERDLGGGVVELALVSDKAGKAQLQDAKASGDARLKVVSPSAKSGHATTTSSDLAGDVLTAHFVPVDGVQRISVVNGAGHTSLRQVNAEGVVNTSSGDGLEVHFKPAVGHAGGATDEISSAVQEGNVTMTQTPVKKPGDASAPQEEKATAARAVYDGGTQKLTLTGNVQMADAGSILWADRVALQQQTGDAEADGTVKASYQLSGKESEPVHVLAVRGVFKHDAGLAMFYGGAGKPARLWQGASQVEAPVIQFDQKKKELVAHGAVQGDAMAVHTVLVSAGNAKAGAKPGAAKTEVVRVASRELNYSDANRQAEFNGGVQVESADGRMRGQDAVVYLQAAQKTGAGDANVKKTASAHALASAPSGFMGGGVERIVATGHIQIDQPGRRATGERAVYTASDGMFVMTGTAAVLPQLVDDIQGTVTGTSLRFHTGDESVMVSNGVSGGVEGKQRVRTETRVKKDR
ncbi:MULTISPECIES: LptA/OstA family protein [Acidobacteriaceae]|uniref:LptA/OstA family protein n=1 Tax=Acidobacteriaceae TaxID=204434 RepID=UPI00131BD8F4|nr:MULTISPECIES: LptA/OstA family protein [Acidobacteriaceae]MDW5267138.1 LptA/OstA family protein [Edaphobacter sp.]